MNDFEDNFPQTEEGNGEPAQNEALEQELEQIRDLFQKSLDGEELEQEYDGENEENAYDEAEYDFEDRELCQKCGERPTDDTKGEDYPYCAQCARELSKKPLGVKGVLVIVAALIVAFASMYVTATKYNPEADIYAIEAQSYSDEGKLESALDRYVSYFSSYQGKLEWAGKKAAMRAAKLYAACGYYSDAHDLISNLFTEQELEKPAYKSMKEIENEYLILNATYNSVYELISEPLSTSDYSTIDTDAVCASLDELKGKEIVSEDGANGQLYSDMFIEYYKFSVLSAVGAPLEEQYEQLKKVAQLGEGRLWLYGEAMSSVAAKMGDTQAAEEMFNKRVAFNKEDTTVYSSYANAYRFCENPDADKIIDIINSGINDGNKAECDKMLAIAYIMKGDYEKAYEYSTELYNTGNYSLQGIYVHAVCAILNKDEDTYNSLEQMLSYYGYSMGDSIVKLNKGKIKIDKLIYDAEGELA